MKTGINAKEGPFFFPIWKQYFSQCLQRNGREIVREVDVILSGNFVSDVETFYSRKETFNLLRVFVDKIDHNSRT